ncbi:LacI family DNA-binding transcriptional regulator [Nakamurella flavida]
MREVAHAAGVSIKTVSRVVNGDRYVTEPVQDRVRAAIETLGYVPNLAARTLRTGREAAIGVAVPQITDPFFAAVVQAVEDAARPRGAAVIVTSYGNDAEAEQSATEALLSRQVSGLISVPVAADQSYLRSWQAKVPMVFIDRRPQGIVADSVVEDDVTGARQAVEHLLAHGHRDVAILGDPPEVPTAGRRLEGYRAALAAAGIAERPDLVCTAPTVSADPLPHLRRLLAGKRAPTAVFSANARCSLGVIPALQRLGRTDVAVISYGDFAMAQALVPAVTVVRQDPQALGEFAVARLMQRVDQPTARLRRHTVLPVRMELRQSCGLGARDRCLTAVATP